jgi:hypothetical protein
MLRGTPLERCRWDPRLAADTRSAPASSGFVEPRPEHYSVLEMSWRSRLSAESCASTEPLPRPSLPTVGSTSCLSARSLQCLQVAESVASTSACRIPKLPTQSRFDRSGGKTSTAQLGSLIRGDRNVAEAGVSVELVERADPSRSKRHRMRSARAAVGVEASAPRLSGHHICVSKRSYFGVDTVAALNVDHWFAYVGHSPRLLRICR